ncbi:hypothetical protein DPMN_079586 [Dreissena polymorpha]|uniref:PA14 domain-containing protein n=1 Tax=Dreissena polymorpha TaxID=45954 RepID=A0A9D3YSU8_DREPO|nr:hypothetical protein DPMN_079586 [Dreissena polymorpha]
MGKNKREIDVACCRSGGYKRVVMTTHDFRSNVSASFKAAIKTTRFSVNQFSQNDDPDVGNRVYLVSESGSERTCAVHKDGCTETQVMCYTPRGLQEESYYVRVVVDGERIPEDSICGGNSFDEQCIFQPKMDNTPTIRTFSPQSGMPGTFVTMKGTMYSDRYGSNMATATNGNLEKLLRVYVGPQDCSLKNGDQFFGLSLESEESDDGTLVCQTMGTSIGFYNASYIVDSPYGRLATAQVNQCGNQILKAFANSLDPDETPQNVASHQDPNYISEISHSSGSTTGGLALTIVGSYYDNRPPYVQPKVFIGDTPCVITDLVVDQHIVCEVAADPQYIDSQFPGNRGVNFEYWTATAKGQTDLNSILSMSSSDPNYHSDWLDETFYHDVNNTMDQFVSRMTTFFTAPHTGKYQFLLFADDGARLFVDGVAEVTSTAAWAGSRQISLNQGQRVLLQVVHYESTQRSFVHLKAKFFDTKFTSAWTGKAEQEKQAISIRSDITYDVQEVQTVEVTSDMDDEGLSAALSSLPVLGPGEAINVVRKPVDTPTFTLTFVSKRGRLTV